VFRDLSGGIRLGLPRDGFFRAGLLVSVLQGLSAVALLGVSAWLISRAAEVSSIVYLGLAIVGVRGFAVGRATFRYFERLLLHESAFRMLSKIRPQIFDKLVPFIPAGLSTLKRGETVSRVVNDVDELQNLSLRVIAPLLQSLVVSIVSTVFIWILLPASGWTLLITLLLAFMVALPMSAKFAGSSDNAIAPLKAEVANLSLDLLENQNVYLAYGWMADKRAKLSAADSRLMRAVAKSAISNGLGSGLVTLLSMAAVISGGWFGGGAVAQGQLPGASLAVFTLLPMAIFEVIQSAQPAVSAYRRFKVSAFRINAILNREVPEEISFAGGTTELPTFIDLELNDVSIRYPDSAKPAVGSFGLKLRAGESVLLSGESGAGKSSIALVLARLLKPSKGAFLINGSLAEVYHAESVRKLIGLVEQNPTVFLGDVRANLALAKPDATDAKLISVLKEVGLWSMFEAREGLDTQLGDRGVLISGGEAQRLALARAVLADFRVLILDEPTANVDQKTADQLVADLLRIVRSKPSHSVVLISHETRFSKLVDREIRLADRG
jgi:ATP-binding cassette subfamily C protein CydC